MNRKATLSTLKCLAATGALLAVGLVSIPVDAGFVHDGWAGTGHQTSEIVPIGPLLPAQQAYVDAVANAGFPDNAPKDPRAKATEIHQVLCKAIELVKKQDADVGDCLEKLKKNGAICVSFDMEDAAGGIATNGNPECNANDKINITHKIFHDDIIFMEPPDQNCPNTYDPWFYRIATTLLHEGTHATQDYATDTTGLDDCKALAAEILTNACNEANSGDDGEPKGAHVIENEWITEIKAALTELGTAMPAADPAWSDATKEMFDGINMLNDMTDPKRQDAIDALDGATSANEKGNNDAIDCYRDAKTALQDFLDTEYTTAKEKTAALEALRMAADGAKWAWLFDGTDLLPKTLLSNAQSPIIKQFVGSPNANNLNTGLLGVSDMELIKDVAGDISQQFDALLVVGPTGLNQGQLHVYVDSNENGMFEAAELSTSIPMPPGVSGNMDLILPESGVPSLEPYLLYNHDTFEFFEVLGNLLDGLPVTMLPLPSFQIQQPQNVDRAYFVQEWDWHGQQLVGYYDEIAAIPALLFDDELLVLDDLNLDGVPDFEAPIATVLSLIDFAPTWGGDPQAGDTVMELYGYPNRQIEVRVLDSNYATIETLASQLTTSVDPVTATLSRPLAANDWIILADLNNGMSSPLLVIPTPPCPGDINGDGTTDTADLGVLLSNFGLPGANPSDLNGDGFTDTADLGILLGNFGCPN